MGNEKQENLPDIIKDRKVLPYEVKNNIRTNLFYNSILFMIMLIITLIINISFDKLQIKTFDTYIDIIQIFCAIISVGILEVAYRKDSGTIGLYGIEFLIYSILVLFVPYMYISKNNIEFLKIVSFGFLIYYIMKSLITFCHMRNSYLKENMSDVKEIVKEEKEGYLDEESIKTLKLQKVEAEMRQKARQEKMKKSKESNNKKEN